MGLYGPIWDAKLLEDDLGIILEYRYLVFVNTSFQTHVRVSAKYLYFAAQCFVCYALVNCSTFKRRELQSKIRKARPTMKWHVECLRFFVCL